MAPLRAAACAVSPFTDVYYYYRYCCKCLLYLRLFVSWTVRNRNQIQKQRDRQRKTQYEQHQQYSKHTCVVYSISNEQFTELSPGTTQSFKFIQHCIFYFTFNIITSKITNIHVKFFTQRGTFTRHCIHISTDT